MYEMIMYWSKEDECFLVEVAGEGVLYHRVCDIAEDEYDLLSYQKAMQDYQSDPVTYTLDEVEYELGLK